MLLALVVLASPVIHVSPSGDDRADGLRRSVRSLPVALERSREAHAGQIQLDPGEYRITEPIRLDKRDQGLQIIAKKAGSASVLGSRRLTGWKVDGKGWWHLTLPEVAAGKWNFIQLWVNGERRFRPRLGYYSIAERLPATPAVQAKGYDRFGYNPGDLNPHWQNLSDVEVLAIHSWSMARMRIASVDEASHVVTFTGPTCSTADWAAFPKGNKYLVENVKEALGKPGEFYLDRPTGELTYIPKPGERLEKADVEAPVATSLVEFDGASSVVISGVQFSYTNWVTPNGGHDYPQADIDVPAAVNAVNSIQVGITKCEVSHTGGYAVAYGAQCQDCIASDSRLWDLGGGGVILGTTHSDGAFTERHIVGSCRIVSGGRLHPASVGVWIGDSSGNCVMRNEIRDLYYTGISVGWTWGYGLAHSGDNIIVQNIISNLGQHVLSDMGGIYTLGNQAGTVLGLNRIFDVTCQAYGGWGIYPDEGTTDETIENNLVYGCQSAGFHQHYGKDNVVTHNVFALNGEYEVMRSRAEDHKSFTFKENVIAWDGGTPFGSNWTGTGFTLIDGIFWHYGGHTHLPAQEPNGRVVDPAFVNPKAGDFRLRKNSPLAAILKKWQDTLNAGPITKEWLRPVPPVPPAFPNPLTK